MVSVDHESALCPAKRIEKLGGASISRKLEKKRLEPDSLTVTRLIGEERILEDVYQLLRTFRLAFD